MATNEDEEFEFRARAEKESQKGGGKPPLGFVAKQMWGTMPQNPKNLLKNLPLAAGALGGASPLVGGAMIGTGVGQAARYLGDKAFKQPVPSGLQHGLEMGGAALADFMAIPAIKSKIYGGQIGEAEKAKGVIARGATKSVTPGSVGQTLTDLEAQLDSGVINTPQAARDAKEVVDQVYKNPKIYEQTPGINVQAQRVSDKAQELINSLIPGRRSPSEAMGKALTLPRLGEKVWRGIPQSVKYGMGVGGGATGTVGIYQILKKLLDG